MRDGCALCPRNCGADRKSAPGVCGQGVNPVVARAAPHFGEEPCVSGTRGSGTVFFSGCPLGCVYCQNAVISRGNRGIEISTARLRDIFMELEKKSVHNLNLVTGTHFLPSILAALEGAAPRIPVIWNSSGYESLDTVRRLSERVNVFLPDLKYLLPEPAARYSFAPDYPKAATAAIEEMARQTGPFHLDGEGLLQRGVLIRHLVLPGQMENTARVIDWVSDTFPPGTVLFSLMAQYTPCGDLTRFPELARRLTADEWDECLERLEHSRISDGYVQDLSAAGEEAIPAFDGEGVLCRPENTPGPRADDGFESRA